MRLSVPGVIKFQPGCRKSKPWCPKVKTIVYHLKVPVMDIQCFISKEEMYVI